MQLYNIFLMEVWFLTFDDYSAYGYRLIFSFLWFFGKYYVGLLRF